MSQGFVWHNLGRSGQRFAEPGSSSSRTLGPPLPAVLSLCIQPSWDAQHALASILTVGVCEAHTQLGTGGGGMTWIE